VRVRWPINYKPLGIEKYDGSTNPAEWLEVYQLTIKVADRDSYVSYLVFMPKPCTHRMHDPRSIVPHIWSKVFTDIQMSQITYNYYINNVSKDYDDSQRNRIAEDSITPKERQPGQHVA
jgi:hypothetical protein